MDLVSVLLFDHCLAHEYTHDFFLVVTVSPTQNNMASARSLNSTLTTLRDTGLLANTSVYMGPGLHSICEKLAKKADTDDDFKRRFLACSDEEDIASFITESLLNPMKQELKDTR